MHKLDKYHLLEVEPVWGIQEKGAQTWAGRCSLHSLSRVGLFRQENALVESWKCPIISAGDCRAAPAELFSCSLGWGLTLALEGPGHPPQLLKVLCSCIEVDSTQT